MMESINCEGASTKICCSNTCNWCIAHGYAKDLIKEIRQAELVVIDVAKKIGHEETCSLFSPYSTVSCDCELGKALDRLKSLMQK